jgi:hypothetical protein
MISLSGIVFTDETFHTSGRVGRHNCVIWGSVPPREHLEHERDRHKANVWCALTHERFIGPFFFDGDIITSNSFLDMLENYALPKLSIINNNFILQLDSASVHSDHILHD